MKRACFWADKVCGLPELSWEHPAAVFQAHVRHLVKIAIVINKILCIMYPTSSSKPLMRSIMVPFYEAAHLSEWPASWRPDRMGTRTCEAEAPRLSPSQPSISARRLICCLSGAWSACPSWSLGSLLMGRLSPCLTAGLSLLFPPVGEH